MNISDPLCIEKAVEIEVRMLLNRIRHAKLACMKVLERNPDDIEEIENLRELRQMELELAQIKQKWNKGE